MLVSFQICLEIITQMVRCLQMLKIFWDLMASIVSFLMTTYEFCFLDKNVWEMFFYNCRSSVRMSLYCPPFLFEDTQRRGSYLWWLYCPSFSLEDIQRKGSCSCWSYCPVNRNSFSLCCYQLYCQSFMFVANQMSVSCRVVVFILCHYTNTIIMGTLMRNYYRKLDNFLTI